MIGATLFSGIGAPETAMPHWAWPWHAEIEKFPAAVMAARHPRSINLGDVAADDFASRARSVAVPDVLVFGSPCQDFSIAGKRLGLDGARGNLALTALRIVGELGPRWFVFENVPGLMSNWSGGPDCPPVTGESIEGVENSDFAAFLGAVDELGYSLAWCRLDAQHFGVAQRRSRVFAVGYLGDWRYPAAVLLEPESLCGDPPSRNQARQDVAGAIGAGSARSGQRVGRREAAAGQLIANSLRARHNDAHDDSKSTYIPTRSLCLNGGGMGRIDAESETLIPITNRCFFDDASAVAHTLRGEGFDASEDGGGKGTPLVVQSVADTLTSHWHNSKGAKAGKEVGLINPVISSYGVRRLMPVECERLQGYPDNYTLISFRGKPAADGPRYKAIGNSMAVPVMRWILSRIERLDQMMAGKRETEATS